MKQAKYQAAGVLFCLLLLATGLRLYGIARADVINDEVIYAFRSIGYIDFFSSPYQTTPWEWFSDVPWWARLSFHDHPPLTFVIEHIFFKLFGVSIFVLRLPFALAGIGTVWLLYALVKRLVNPTAGLLAALLLAVNQYHVWVSRTGLQESLVIFLILLTLYLFIRALDSGRHWPWGIALGSALLTKYTAVVAVVIIFGYVWYQRRDIFKQKSFWLGPLLAGILCLPIVIYNFMLFKTRGHFDLQLSYLFGQMVPAWQYLPGKLQTGSLTDRVSWLLPTFSGSFMWLSSAAVLFAFLWFGFRRWQTWRLGRAPESWSKAIIFTTLAILAHILLYLLIGPSKRFVAMVIPYFVMAIAVYIAQQRKYLAAVLIIVLVGGEIFFSYNTVIAYYPIGARGLAYSELKVESYSWGYNQLDEYIDHLLAGQRPEFSFETKYQFLEDIRQEVFNRLTKLNFESVSWLLIYDERMYDLATFWLFHRRLVYDGWPVVSSDTFLAQDLAFWQAQGIKEFYFFKVIDDTMLLHPAAQPFDEASTFGTFLATQTPVEIIKRPDGRDVFAVYYWQ